MTKGIDATGQIESVALLEKEGGKSGHWVRP
jgi:molybdenum cofactor biosynthesis enzyme